MDTSTMPSSATTSIWSGPAESGLMERKPTKDIRSPTRQPVAWDGAQFAESEIAVLKLKSRKPDQSLEQCCARASPRPKRGSRCHS
jgi:hypothetical protein